MLLCSFPLLTAGPLFVAHTLYLSSNLQPLVSAPKLLAVRLMCHSLLLQLCHQSPRPLQGPASRVGHVRSVCCRHYPCRGRSAARGLAAAAANALIALRQVAAEHKKSEALVASAVCLAYAVRSGCAAVACRANLLVLVPLTACTPSPSFCRPQPCASASRPPPRCRC